MYDNVDYSIDVTFVGAWTFTDLSGIDVPNVGTIDAGNIAWDADDLGKLTSGNSYIFTWTPSYGENSDTNNEFASDVTITEYLNFCNKATTKKSDAALTLTLTGGNTSTTCSDITAISIEEPTEAMYVNVDTSANVTFGGNWTFTEKSSNTDVVEDLEGDLSFGPTELAKLSENKTYTLTWTPEYSGSAESDYTITSSESITLDIPYCVETEVIVPADPDNSSIL